MDGPALASALERALGEHWGAPVAVQRLEELAGGASRRIYGFTATRSGEPRPQEMVARFEASAGRIPGSGVDEYSLLEVAGEAGVMVPRVHCRGRDPQSGDEFFVMDRARGEAIARRLMREAAYERARAALPGQLARSLARIHSLNVDDPRLASLREVAVTSGCREFAASEIEKYDQLLMAAAGGHPYPVLAYARRWLTRNRPSAPKESVVHGDFRIGNVMFDDCGLTAVLDWELAHVGDPLEDLGWLAVRAWRFGKAQLPIGGLCSREEFWSFYEREGGVRVDPIAARYWEVFGNWKWAIICVMQGASHRAGLVPDVELAAIGRRVADTEWEILDLIEEADRARQAGG
jgi:aminoglycoside phosphotransferase (APT) family kinase protein